jgi:uncharacterized protein YndB with AHSA1/START domain
MPQVIRSIEIPAPPSGVWRWLSTQEGLRRWLAPDLDIDLTVGGAYRMLGTDGQTWISGTVLELVPEGRLVLSPGLFVAVEHRAMVNETGAVEQDVAAPRALGELHDRLAVGHIEPRDQDVALALQPLELVCRDVGGMHLRPFARKGDGRRPADALGRRGDHRRLSRQTSCHGFSRCRLSCTMSMPEPVPLCA